MSLKATGLDRIVPRGSFTSKSRASIALAAASIVMLVGAASAQAATPAAPVITATDPASPSPSTKAWERAETAAKDFERERAAYLRAVQMHLGAGRLRRMLDRAKKSNGADEDVTGPAPEA